MSPRNKLSNKGTGKHTAQPATPPPSVLNQGKEKGNLLSFVAPTEFVDLPTQGKYYPQGHPLHNKDVLEIKYMTAKHEDLLTSPTLLRKGVAIDRLLQSLVIDESINVDDMFVGDKNALIIASRITGYGSEYKLEVPCPSCGAQNDHVFDLSALEHVQPSDEELEKYDITVSAQNTFLITLPVTKVVMEVRLMSGHDEKQIERYNKMLQKNHGLEAGMTDQLKQIIVSLNEETDRGIIDQFVDNMPAKDAQYFRLAYAVLTPNVKMKQDFACSYCGHEQEVNVPLTAEFFWPRQ